MNTNWADISDDDEITSQPTTTQEESIKTIQQPSQPSQQPVSNDWTTVSKKSREKPNVNNKETPVQKQITTPKNHTRIICKQCHSPFFLTNTHINWFKQHNLHVPKRCSLCV